MQDGESDEQDLEDAFRVSAEFGLEVLHEAFRYHILALIKSDGLGLSVADFDDVYQTTMIEMLLAARKPDFDPIRPLRLVQDIAKKRTIDMRRRRRLRLREVTPDFHDHLIEDIKGSKLGDHLKYESIDWPEFDKALWDEIGKLPPMQKTAATCFVDVYEEVRKQNSYAPLADAMGDYLQAHVTVASAKSAWHEAKAKISRQLARRGFNFLGEIDP